MLLPTEREYLVRKEQYERLIRELELAHVINELVKPSRPKSEIYRSLINQLGSQMIKLGEKMKTYGAASSGKLA